MGEISNVLSVIHKAHTVPQSPGLQSKLSGFHTSSRENWIFYKKSKW